MFGGSRENLNVPKKVKALFNVKTTSTKPPDFVLDHLEKVLRENGYDIKKKGYVFAVCVCL